LVGEQSTIASGGREITKNHNMRDMTRMTAVWYGTRIGVSGVGGGGGQRQDADNAEGNGGGGGNRDGNNPEGRWCRVPPWAGESHDVGGR
jgi:hypothetical protein